MAAPDSAPPAESLAARVRALRAELRRRSGRPVRQADVANALGVSVALISSWETGTAAVPEERIEPLARFFATSRSVAGPRAALVKDLDEDDEGRRTEILDELRILRGELAAGIDQGRERTTFWQYPEDGLPIRILTSRMSRRALTSPVARDHTKAPGWDPVAYSDPWHPNHIRSLWDGDRDATIELYGEIRAENPRSDVRFVTADRITAEDVTGHVVVLGGADTFDPDDGKPKQMSVLDHFIRRHDLPWFVESADETDEEFGFHYTVTLDEAGNPRYFPVRGSAPMTEVHAPVFFMADPDEEGDAFGRRLNHGWPMLDYDVAVIARMPNQLNLNATLTICAGLFSRGTLGAIRAFTDPKFRESNESWLDDKVDRDHFWMLTRVPIFPSADGARTVTPDLARELHCLRLSSGRS